MRLGNVVIKNAKLGTTQIKRIMAGTTLVWQYLTVTLTNGNFYASGLSGTINASWGINGVDVWRSINGSSVTLYAWLQGGSASDYQIRWTTTSGAVTSAVSAATGTWLECTSNPTWGVQRTTNGSSNATGSVDIRLKSTSAVVASATITLQAERGTV